MFKVWGVQGGSYQICIVIQNFTIFLIQFQTDIESNFNFTLIMAWMFVFIVLCKLKKVNRWKQLIDIHVSLNVSFCLK